MTRTTRLLLATVATATAAVSLPAQSASRVQVWRVDGGSYHALPATPATDSAIASARRLVASQPDQPASYVTAARAYAATWQMREAIDVLSQGLQRFPDNVELLRWRGHRYLSVREFDRATVDLERGLHLAADNYGLWYHAGIVRFIRGEYDRAAEAFESARLMPPDSNEAAGSADWLYLSYLRAGRDTDARRLLRSLPNYRRNTSAYARRIEFYRGRTRAERLVTPDDTAKTQVATLRFGLATALLARGDTAGAYKQLEQVIRTDAWASFSHIAATEMLAELNLFGPWPFTWPGDFGPIPFVEADEEALSCFASIPDERTTRVNASVLISLDPTEDFTPATSLLRDRFARTFRTAVERYQRAVTQDSTGALLNLDSRLAWHGMELGFVVVLSRNGAIRLEPAPPRSGSPYQADSAATLIAELVEAARGIDGGTVSWSDERAADTLTLRMGIAAPIPFDSAVVDLFPSPVRIPLGTLHTPRIRAPYFVDGKMPEFPGLAADIGVHGSISVIFTIAPNGDVDSNSVTSPPMTTPVPQTMRYVIDDYLQTTYRAVRTWRFQPAAVGGCPVSSVILAKFRYGFRP